MSYLLAAPERFAAKAADLATIASSLSAARTAAADPTVALVPAAADEVSASVAHLFARHAQAYQAAAGQAAAIHEQFTQNLTASARSYAATEVASTASLLSAQSQSPLASAALLPVDVTLGEAFVLLPLAFLLLPAAVLLALPLLFLTGHIQLFSIHL